MHRAVSLVLLPRGAGDVTAHDRLNGQDAELADLHAAVLEDRSQRLGDLRGQVEGQEVRAEGGESGGEHFEPFAGAEGEEDAFVGDALVIISLVLIGMCRGIENWGIGMGHTFSIITS